MGVSGFGRLQFGPRFSALGLGFGVGFYLL